MRRPRYHRVQCVLIASVATLSLAGCASFSVDGPTTREERPFFQKEQATEIHGRKNWFDYLVEADPGNFQVETVGDYLEHPPAIVAVLPFGDEGDANFTIDKIPITFRDKRQQERWAWTDAQRLRLSVVGHLAQREFTVVNPLSVDAVLKQLGIDNMKKLKRVSPSKLGRLLAADAVVYGQVDSYEGFYFGVVSAYHVAVSMRMSSTNDGRTLIRARGSRYSVDIEPAMTPFDFAISSIKTLVSIKTLLEFRDITLARAEEEVGRELVLRIPPSERLKTELAKRALERAQAAGSDGEPPNQSDPQVMSTVTAPSVPRICASGCFGKGRTTRVTNMAGRVGNDRVTKLEIPIDVLSPTGRTLENALPIIRHELAVGEYAKAQGNLAALQPLRTQLSQSQRREIQDDLCLTEYLIGQVSYPWPDQQRTCSEALGEPGSVSGAILAQIHDAMKRPAP